MELWLEGRPLPLERKSEGWWRSTVIARPGHDYGFVLDGAEPLPDPRSRWQPHGVHGLSRVDAPAAYRWSDSDWRGLSLSEAVIYELHTGTFTEAGTFEGIVEKLPHLLALGVNCLELMPVVEFAGERGWGYDGVDLYAPHHAYGGPEALRRLVDACHQQGLAVVLDVVYNHLGPEGNYLGRYGPYFTSRHQTPWGDAVNFDGLASRGVRDFVIDNALMWLRDYHVDGLRLDAVGAILDSSARHILTELADRVHLLGRELRKPLFLIGEQPFIDPPLLALGLDAQWEDDVHHSLHVHFTAERQGYYAPYTGSPGELAGFLLAPRELGVPYERVLTYSQTHDQIGNRALGERLCHLASPQQCRSAATLTLLSPFVPMLFMGEEWAASTPFQFFSDHRDPTIARLATEGRIREFAGFGWRRDEVSDSQDPATYRCSKLNWSELNAPPHQAMLAHYSSLLAQRRSIHGQPYQVSWTDQPAAITFGRGRRHWNCPLES